LIDYIRPKTFRSILRSPLSPSRQMFLVWTILFFSSFVAAIDLQAKENKTVLFSTLDWPPYLGSQLPQQGFGFEIARQAFEAEGYTLTVDYLPWSRALLMASSNPKYSGCLLAYYSEERAKKFIFSDPVTSGSVMLAERKNHTFKLTSLADLTGATVGIVQDYVNPPEVTKLVNDKKIKAETALSDSRNLLKLANNRIDFAIIDKFVFLYLMQTNPDLKPSQNLLQLNPRVLEDKKLYLIFPKTAAGQQTATVFNRGLKKINVPQIIQQYFNPNPKADSQPKKM